MEPRLPQNTRVQLLPKLRRGAKGQAILALFALSLKNLASKTLGACLGFQTVGSSCTATLTKSTLPRAP